MLDKFIRYAFALTGALTGVTITRFLLVQAGLQKTADSVTGIGIMVLTAVLLGVLLYFLSGRILNTVNSGIEQIEKVLSTITLYELLIATGGLIAGLIVANLISIPIVRLQAVGVVLSIMINILFGISGVYFAMVKRHETLTGKSSVGGITVKLLDTSAIIDGRILDVCRTSFLEGELIVPGFVLEELRHLADSHDDVVRAKGRRGLDVLNAMKKELKRPVRIEKKVFEGNIEVDEQLLLMAKELNAAILTTDYNLGKVATFRGIPVLNVNDLANAMKPMAITGDEMMVRIVKDGKEAGQGVAYLDDGTMVVVDGGQGFKGQDVDVVVTSVLQTSAGRMVFARYKMQHLSIAK